jgi:hypothetical protein
MSTDQPGPSAFGTSEPHATDEALSACLDGELTASEGTSLGGHLAHCGRCAARLRALGDAASSLRAPVRFPDPAIAAGAVDAAVSQAPALVSDADARPRRRPLVALSRAAAVAAVTLAGAGLWQLHDSLPHGSASSATAPNLQHRQAAQLPVLGAAGQPTGGRGSRKSAGSTQPSSGPGSPVELVVRPVLGRSGAIGSSGTGGLPPTAATTGSVLDPYALQGAGQLGYFDLGSAIVTLRAASPARRLAAASGGGVDLLIPLDSAATVAAAKALRTNSDRELVLSSGRLYLGVVTAKDLSGRGLLVERPSLANAAKVGLLRR